MVSNKQYAAKTNITTARTFLIPAMLAAIARVTGNCDFESKNLLNSDGGQDYSPGSRLM